MLAQTYENITLYINSHIISQLFIGGAWQHSGTRAGNNERNCNEAASEDTLPTLGRLHFVHAARAVIVSVHGKDNRQMY